MKDRTWVGRALRVMLVVVMVLPFIGYFAPAASAHHPEIEGRAFCDEATGAAVLSWTATAWTTTDWFRRTTPDDSVRIDLLTGSTVEIGSGEFNSTNEYSFGGLYDASALMGQTVKVKAIAEQGFYTNAALTTLTSAGENRTTGDIAVPVCPGSITVIKDAVGGDGTFSFVSESLGDFGLVTSGGTASTTFRDLPEGTYDVAEDVTLLAIGWELSDDPAPYCEGSAHEGAFAPTEFVLAAGESVICTFTNVYTPPPLPGAITVIKNTENPETSREFSFLLESPDVISDTQTAAGDGGSYTWWELEAGTYELTELVGLNPAGYSLIGRSCVFADTELDSLAAASVAEPGEGTGTPITNGMSVDLEPGDHIVCTFTNRHSTPPTTQPPALGSIGDLVWNDGPITDANGIQDAGEAGVSGLLVTLLDGAGTILATTTTDESGHYLFADLSAGTYVVEFSAGSDASFTIANESGPDATDSDANRVTGRTGLINLAAGQDDMSWDAGLVTATVSPTTVTRPPETLPFTGTSSGGMGGAAVALLLLGGLVLLGVRSKEDSGPTTYCSDQ